MKKCKTITGSIRILIVELVNRNLGDAVIAETTRYLIKSILPKKQQEKFIIYNYNIYSQDFELLKESDLIIFAGGGLIKYEVERFAEYVPEILNIAQVHDIPVLFNCVGVEGFDEEDERCQNLKQALNFPCVKRMTVRDDIDCLREHYIEREDIKLVKTIDCAVVSNMVFGVEKRESNTIGLGIVRSEIFADYGNTQIDKEYQLQFWKQLIEKIEAKGYEWQLFVNGLASDYNFALEVLVYCGRDNKEKYLAKQAVTSKELVNIIAGYKAVVAGRMHSNIIAYSLGIPSIGLVWNEKLNYWGERTGYKERMVSVEQLEASYVMDRLNESIKKGVRRGIKQYVYKRRAMVELRGFIDEYASTRSRNKIEAHKEFPWKKYMVATALGGEYSRYSGMNCINVMKKNKRKGFLWHEVDVRLTLDRQLVCVNGWSEKTFEKLMVADRFNSDNKPTKEQFLQMKYYGEYATCDFSSMIAEFSRYKKCKLIIDIGKPSQQELECLVSGIGDALQQYEQISNRVVLRLQSRKDIVYVKSVLPDLKLAYYLPSKEVRERKRIDVEQELAFCKKRKIKMLTIPKEALEKELVKQIHNYGMKVCVFSLNKYTEVKEAIFMGVDLIGTHHLGVKMLGDLITETFE